MNNLKLLMFLGVSLFCHQKFYAQPPGGPQTLLDTNNTWVKVRSIERDSFGNIFWWCDSLQPGHLFKYRKSQAGLGVYDSMHLEDTFTDPMTALHNNTYHQFYKGVRVENATYTELFDDHGVYVTTGWIIEDLDLSPEPTLSESSALALLLGHIDADEYLWEIPMDTCFPDTIGDTCAFTDYYPHGELVFYNVTRDANPSHYVLAWRFSVVATDPYSSMKYYVNATDGTIINAISLNHGSNADHWYYGTVGIDDKW